jgi:HAMP domain-containing protein
LHVEETRFHTQFDQWIEVSGVQRMEDEIKKSSPDILYAVGADIGAYVPVTHTEFSQAPTGDAERDRKQFRSKRKFNLPMHIASSLWEGSDPLVQEYHRDTGDIAWDISAPVYVHDPVTGQVRHFGCFRLGVRQDQIAIRRRAAAMDLIVVFSALATVLAIFMFVSLRRTMRPLGVLSESALAISMGSDGMRTPVRSNSTDAYEIGSMAKSLERLRRSLVAAIERID